MNGVVALLVVFGCASLSGCDISQKKAPSRVSGPTTPTALNEYVNMSVAGFAPIHARGDIQLVDVRTPGEFEAGHIPGARNIPIDVFEPNHLMMYNFDKEKPVYLVCQSGNRSGRAAQMIAAAGRQAINIEGGVRQWIEDGYTVE